MMDFCPKCGAKGTDGKLCEQCSGGQQEPKKERKIVVELCIGCSRILVKNKYSPFRDLDEAAKKLLRAKLPEVKNIGILDHGMGLLTGPGIKRAIIITAVLDGETCAIPASLFTTACDGCRKEGGQYFEGILQIRNYTPEILDFIRSDVKKQRGKGVFINEESHNADGLDMKITSQRYIRVLGKKLVKQFGGKIKVNAQLFSKDRQTSKDLYRINVLYEAPLFAVGDVVEFGNGPVKVTGMKGTGTGLNLKTGKKEMLKENSQKLVVHKSRVMSVVPFIEVMHPETFQPLCIRNALLPKVKKGEKVKIVFFDEAYIIS